MDRHTLSRNARTRSFVTAVFLSLLCINPSFADRNGRAGDSGAISGCDCGRCHNGATIPTVSLTGPQSVAVNSVNTYTFSLMGGPGMTAGLGVSATGGTLNATMTGTTMIGAEVVHSTPTPMVSGAIDYTFSWQAPANNGTYTIYASGSSTDGLDNTGGDGSANATITVTVTGATPPISLISVPGGPYIGTAGSAIQFDGSRSAAPAGSTIATYAWTFGDGGTATGSNPTYAYAAAGSYTVILTVIDDKNARASEVTVATVSAAAADGEGADLYAAHCEECHGPGGVGGPDGDVVGADAEDIWEAIEEYPEMNFLVDELNDEHVDAIAMFLDPANSGVGAELYAANCEECHGPDGVGGPDGDVVGEDAEDIWEAIEEYAEMNYLADVLSEEDVEAIGSFLTSLEEDEDDEEEEDGAASIQVLNDSSRNHQVSAKRGSLNLLTLAGLAGVLIAAARFRRRR